MCLAGKDSAIILAFPLHRCCCADMMVATATTTMTTTAAAVVVAVQWWQWQQRHWWQQRLCGWWCAPAFLLGLHAEVLQKIGQQWQSGDHWKGLFKMNHFIAFI
jgi:hypothetical protein